MSAGSSAGSNSAQWAATRPPRHAETLAPAIVWCCEQCDVELSQVSAIAVGIGPGMFTGLRVGVTTAKLLAQSLRIPLIPIPSLDLLVYPLRYARRLVVATIDARRRELYWAIYRPSPGGVQRVSDYELGAPDDVAAALLATGEEAIVCGDGAARFADVFTQLERRVELAGLRARLAQSLGSRRACARALRARGLRRARRRAADVPAA